VPFGVGATELIILLVIVLIIFGPKKLPQLGRSLGGGLREFKNSVSGKGGSDDDDDEPEVIEGPDRSNVTTAAAASDEETETARRQREAKTVDAS
jgi:sec-independent protein translocase protein TatA